MLCGKINLNKNMDCIFCKIVRGEIPCAKVYEDNEVLAFLDINPVNPGHTLVITKEHFTNITDTPEEKLNTIMSAVKKLSGKIMTAVGASAFNLGVNNGEVAGQIVPHVHFHIMPRKENDGKKLWHGTPYREGEMEEIKNKILS